MKWREAVEEYHLENPLTKEEEEKQAAAGGRLRTAVIYGSTVLAAVIADGFSFGLVLGDGGFVVLDEEGHIFIPVEDKNSHANYTSSLCNTDAVHFFEHCIRKSRCGRCLCPRTGYSSPLPARKIFCVITGCCPRCSGMRSGWRKACGGTLRSAPGRQRRRYFHCVCPCGGRYVGKCTVGPERRAVHFFSDTRENVRKHPVNAAGMPPLKRRRIEGGRT